MATETKKGKNEELDQEIELAKQQFVQTQRVLRLA
jgi:hypothetical protein